MEDSLYLWHHNLLEDLEQLFIVPIYGIVHIPHCNMYMQTPALKLIKESSNLETCFKSATLCTCRYSLNINYKFHYLWDTYTKYILISKGIEENNARSKTGCLNRNMRNLIILQHFYLNYWCCKLILVKSRHRYNRQTEYLPTTWTLLSWWPSFNSYICMNISKLLCQASTSFQL